VAQKCGVPIRHHNSWHVVEVNNLFEIEVCNVGQIISGVACYKVSHFLESIHYHHNGILMSLCSWKIGDKIQAYILLRALGNRK